MIVTLVGCGKNGKRDPIKLTLSSEDSIAILNAAGIRLPDAEVAPGAGTLVQWYSWYDPLQNYNEDEVVNSGNWTFREKYEGDVKWIQCDYFDYYDDLARLLAAGTPPDATQASNGVMAMYPMNCIKKMIQPVDDYIDYDDPLWAPMKRFADYFVLGGKHYHIVTDVSFVNVVPYNRRVLNEFGYEDPADLYRNDEWTWDKFYEMCMDFNDPDNDRFALDGNAYGSALIESTGQAYFTIDQETGEFYANIDSPAIERSQDLIYDLVKNDCCYNRGTWNLRGNGVFGSGVKDGLTLFYIIETWAFTGRVEEVEAVWGDMSAQELMFAPLPRDPNGDGNYYLRSAISGYSIIAGSSNPEGVALLAACDRFKIVDPIVIQIDKKQLKEKYLWTDEMIDMRDECYRIAASNPVLDINNNLPDNLGNAINALQTGIIRAGTNPTSWAQLKDTYRDQIEFYIDDLNKTIDDYNNGLL